MKTEETTNFIGANGISRASVEVNVSFPSVELGSQIRVKKIFANVGNKVERGQKLAELDSISLKQEIYKLTQDTSYTKTKLNLVKEDFALKSEHFKTVEELVKKGYATLSELEHVRQGLYESDLKLSGFEQELTDTRLRIKSLKTYLAEMLITSPIEGIVLKREIEQGEIIKSGSPLFTVGDLSPIYVTADVSQEDMDIIHTGQSSEITFNFLSNKHYTGKVVSIEPDVDNETQTFKVHVSVPNDDSKLLPGSAAFVRFKAKRKTLVIPRVALIGIPENPAVFILGEDNKVFIRGIVKGASLPDGRIEVLEGLREGDKVVTINQKNLKEGMTVTVENPQGN